ncbi:MAG: Rieske 2Fe-2S domain-containing protein [Pseudomonadota bacterium]|nr:Rieske 2Fe-2S domain-containing protein [Pseudomonadota bacterium]
MEKVEYPQSWYPVARSRDLKPGRHRIVNAFDSDWLLFRTRSGQVGLTGRHCCHMGADLAQGAVCGEAFECALHGWRFDTSGRCTHIPTLTEPHRDIRLYHLVCQERYGVIFAFWGEQPAFELPFPPRMECELSCSTPYTLDMETEYHTPSLNTFDVQHFERIHNRRFVSEPDITRMNTFCLRMDYEAEILKRRWVDYIMAMLGPHRTNVTIDCWGSSMLLLRNQETGFGGFVGMLPMQGGLSRVFIVALRERYAGSRATGHYIARGLVALAGVLMRGFLKPDVRVITRMRPFRGNWIDELDAGAQMYWDYLQQLPRWDGNQAVRGN